MSRFQEAPNIGRAADLLSAIAAVGAPLDDVAQSAVKIVHDTDLLLVHEVGAWLIEGDPVVDNAMPEVIDSRRRIHRLKGILNEEPRNAIRWVDLSREYAALGQTTFAERAMTIALELAPDDRFVLQGATALYEHTGDLERALRLLMKTTRLSSDPWLVSAAVALSDLMRAKQTHARLARRMLDDADVDPVDLAELAAALGTVEFRTGSDRRARQLFRRSALSPTENALAQIVWADERFGDRLSEDAPADIPRNFEAPARQQYFLGEWENSLQAGLRWLDDQPFSASAASFASSTACNADNWTIAIEVATRGLRANPEDVILMNNLAYALGEEGRLKESARRLIDARRFKSPLRTRALLTATEGFLLFRAGFPQEGRLRYRRAVDAFVRLRDLDSTAKAALMLAREEALAQSSEEEKAYAEARQFANRSKAPEISDLFRKVTELRMLSEKGYHAIRNQPPRLLGVILKAPLELEGEKED